MMSAGPYAQIGASLVERGYAALPIIPGTKRPGLPLGGGDWRGMDDWAARAAARLPIEIEVDQWSASNGGVCVAHGPASRGTVSADIDTDDPDIMAAILAVLPVSMVGKAGQKGETLFYRAGPGFMTRRFNVRGPDGVLRRVLDLLGPGTQTVLPPTVHPDTGQPYRWTRTETLDAVDPDDLPWIDDDIGDALAEALKPFGYEAETAPPPRRETPAGEEAPHRRLNNLAMDDLGAWVPDLGLYKLKRRGGGYVAVPTWRPSHTGRSLEKRGQNLKIHQDGIRDFHDGERPYTPLDLVMCARGLELDQAFMWLADRVGFGETIAVDIAPRAVERRDGVLIDAETGEIIDEAPAATNVPPEINVASSNGPAGDPRDFPDEYLQVPGLVGDIADWIEATSPKPIRLFAIGAALAVVGTLVGRRVYCGRPLSGTALYQLAIAGTGSGKERSQEAMRQILDAVSPERLHTGAASSAASLAMRLAERPVQVQIIDEVDKVLARAGARQANAQERELVQDYCTLWGRLTGTFSPNSTTTRGDIQIKHPSMSFFGATTPTSFYEHLKAKLLAGGFLNRFLVLPRFQRVRGRKPRLPEEVVPDALIASARRLFAFQDVPPPGVDPRRFVPPSSSIQDPDRPPEMRVIELTPAAEAILAECRDRDEAMMERADRDPLFEAWVRGAEMTKRVALIVACGRYADDGLEGCIVDEGDMLFARRLVDWSIDLFVTGMRENMAETDFQANAKLVLGHLRKAGRVLTRSEIYRRVDNRLKSRDLEDVMASLVTSGQVELLEEQTGGRPKKSYRLLAETEDVT
ncbi:DUF3987 domain-containing protein [Methylobacterium sp. D54C]